jgi:hypothetical protein
MSPHPPFRVARPDVRFTPQDLPLGKKSPGEVKTIGAERDRARPTGLWERGRNEKERSCNERERR